MKIEVFAVFDSQVKVFGQPNFCMNVAHAQRIWAEAAIDPQSNVSKHPSHYTLFHIGTWDDETAQFQMLEAKVSLGTALEARAAAQAELRKENPPAENLLHVLPGANRNLKRKMQRKQAKQKTAKEARQ